MGPITAILFDKDGTLFDFHLSWGDWTLAVLTELACGDPQRVAALAAAIEFDLPAGRFERTSPVIAGTVGDAVARMLPLLPGMNAAELVYRLNEAAAEAPMHPAVPLLPLLTALSGRGLALGVATNEAEAPARRQLAAAGIAPLFDFIAGCDSGHGAKPAPGQLIAFAEATGRAPREVLMVGDSRHDLAAGRAAGMVTVGVLTGPAEAADLADLADAVLPDIGHLPGLLDRLSA
jgi:phosphoglycolate phosphatase